MTSKLLQILDDNSGDFEYSEGQWTLSAVAQWYQGTQNYIANANSTTSGTFTLSFEGTSIAFVGNTPPGSQTATVSIDGSTPYTITYPSLPPPAYVQWYQSPALSDGTHTITVDHLDGTAVDFALIEVGQNTSLAGKTIVVDDEDPAIQYSGNWNLNIDAFTAGSQGGFPVHNSTHQSVTPGDTITFRFSGTSADVYGVFNWDDIGLLSATYTLDGTTVPQSYLVTMTSPNYGSAEAINFPYFSQDNLAAGDHTLVINITECQNQRFMLDYITYSPSFSTLATMPNLTVSTSSLSPSSSSTSKISSSPSIPNTSSTTTQSGLPSSQDKTDAKSVLVGAIAGGCVGGILLLVLLAFLLLRMRKRRSDTESMNQATALNTNGAAYSSAQMGELPRVWRAIGQSDGAVSPFQDPAGALAHSGSGLIANLKRERADLLIMRSRGAAGQPLAGATNQDTSSAPVNRPSNASMNPQVGGPPAYDALSAYHSQSNMILPSQQ